MKALKALVAVIGGAITSALTIWGPDTTVGQVLVVVAALLTAVSVYLVPNAPAVPDAVRAVREREVNY